MTSGEEHRLVEARDHKFCPWCASSLEKKDIDGRSRLKCPNCDFVWYRNPIPAAGAIITRSNRLLLAKRKYPPRVGYWGIPAGFLEYDESPVECCIREIREETGLEIKINRLFWSYPGHDDPRANAILTLYLAEIIGGSLSAGDDAVEVKFFGWDEIPANIAFQAHRQALADFKRFLDTGKLPSG